MARDAKAYLADVVAASERIASFIEGVTYEQYGASVLLRSAVERQFEITGEALRKLADFDPAIAARVPEYRRVISFRNVLVHGYASVDNRLVWEIATGKLPELLKAAKSLLERIA